MEVDTVEVVEVPNEGKSAVEKRAAKPRKEIRKIFVPRNRHAALKEQWLKIFTPVVEQLLLQIRYNMKSKQVEIRLGPETRDPSNLQRGADFVQAFITGFDVEDALALLRLDDLFVESFDIQDVKTLKGDHLSRSIGRLAGKGGRTKFTLENTTKTRIVLQNSKIHILGNYKNIQYAKRAVSHLILGSPASKVGKYGIVRRAVNRKTGIQYAAKFLRRRRRGQCCAKEINHEIAVLMLCASSQHIVRLHAVHETRSETALILELATGGELQTMIDNKGQLSEEQTRTCMREILRALNHLHKQSIAHLDLKPQNILLSGGDVEDGLKLCDFGIARIVGDTGKIYEILGTPDYVAPEVLHYEPLSLKTDIWSIGVLTYVLLTGCSPFGGDNKQETFLNITKCLLTFPEELFEDVSEEAIDFIKCALRIKPKERPTVEECLQHRWLTDDGISSDASAELAITVAAQLHKEQQTPEPVSCPIIISSAKKVILSTATTEHNNQEDIKGQNGYSTEPEKSAEPTTTTDDEAETNKENVQVQSNGVSQQQQQQQSAPPASVVEIVTVSLFPDAPTTPKVCRKAPPSEHNHNGHHYHHLHSSNNNNNNNNVVMLSNRQSSGGPTVNSSPQSHVKTYVQKFQQQQQQQESSPATTQTAAATTTVMLPVMENGFCAAAATLCCLKCSEESATGATGLAVAVATVASRKTLQCGDKGIIC